MWRRCPGGAAARPVGGLAAAAAASPPGPDVTGVLIAESLEKVTIVNTTRIRAAATVQPISRLVLPRIWAAILPRRWAKRNSEYTSAISTARKTKIAM